MVKKKTQKSENNPVLEAFQILVPFVIGNSKENPIAAIDRAVKLLHEALVEM